MEGEGFLVKLKDLSRSCSAEYCKLLLYLHFTVFIIIIKMEFHKRKIKRRDRNAMNKKKNNLAVNKSESDYQ